MENLLRILTAAVFFALGASLSAARPVLAQDASSIAERYKFESLPEEEQRSLGPSEAVPVSSYQTDGFLRDQVANERLIVVSISLLALISLALVLLTLYKRKSDSRDIVTGSGLVVIVYGTILLALTVKTDQQLMAAIGIMGAIAGYLFGTTKSSQAGQPRTGQAATRQPPKKAPPP